MSAVGLCFRDVEVRGRRGDVTVLGAHVASVDPPGSVRATDDLEVIEGQGAALIPGLHDHHLHLLAAAAAAASVTVGPPGVTDGRQLASALQRADARLPSGAWLRAVGYHESVAGPLDRRALDAWVADRPVRVQHRSGALWIVNSVGLGELGIGQGRVSAGDLPSGCETDDHGVPVGRLWRLDGWLNERISSPAPDLASVGRALASRGVTGVTDMTPVADPGGFALLADAVATGALPQQVMITGGPDLDVTAIPTGLTVGPAKLLLPDHDLPPLDEVVDRIRSARAAGRPVAVHCVTRVAIVLTLAALTEVGAVPGDRIEHGAVVPPELHADLRSMGLTVVTQPNFVGERGDEYLAEVEREDRSHLWPCGSLLRAGIRVGAGTDAPFGLADPWALLDAATTRRTPSGAVLGAGERITPARAIDLLLSHASDPGGEVRRVQPGAPADLCLLDGPLAHALARAPANPVRLVVIGGEVVHVSE